jgi:hypothetical protein
MQLPIVRDLVGAHPQIVFVTSVTFLAVLGYLEIRCFPKELGAYWTLLFALLVASVGLFHWTLLGVFGPVLGILLLIAGSVALIRWYSDNHTRPN